MNDFLTGSIFGFLAALSIPPAKQLFGYLKGKVQPFDQHKYRDVRVDHTITKQYFPGWECTREDLHTGPCALIEEDGTKVEYGAYLS